MCILLSRALRKGLRHSALPSSATTGHDNYGRYGIVEQLINYFFGRRAFRLIKEFNIWADDH